MPTKFARTVGGNWSTAATWSTTSGGAADTSIPTAADDVVLNASSGNVTIDVNSAARSMDCLGYVGVLTHAAAVTLTLGDATAGAGNRALRLVSGMTYTLGNAGTSAITFASTSATQQTIDAGGKNVGNLSFNGVGSSYLQASALTGNTASASFVLNNGTWATGNFAITTAVVSFGVGTATRVWTPGSSAIACGFAAGALSAPSPTGLTVTANTAVVTFSSNTASISSTAVNYNGLTLTFTACATPAITATGAFTIGNLNHGGKAGGSTLTVSGPFTITGALTSTGTNATTARNCIQSLTVGTARTITMTGATINSTNTDYQDITIAGSPTVGTTTSVGNCGGNTGITFTTPVTRYAVAAGNWSSTAMWSASSGGASGVSVPIVHDNVILNASSAAGTYTHDLLRSCADLTCTGFTGTLSNATTGMQAFGTVTLSSGMTLAGTNNLTLMGRGTHAFTSAGLTIPWGLVITGPGGTHSLADNLTISKTGGAALNPNGNGLTFNDNGRTVTLTGATGAFSTANANLVLTGTYNLGATSGTPWVLILSGTTNMASSTINITTASASARTLGLGNSKTYGTINYTVSGSAGQLIFTGTASTILVHNQYDAASTCSLDMPTTSGFAFGTFNVQGRAGALASVNGDVFKASGIVSCNYLNLTNSDATGGATFYAGANSTNGGGNTGWIFTNPPVTSTPGASMASSLNRLAHTTGLEAAGAANVWAGTTGKELVGALNVKAGTTGLELNGVCRRLASLNGGNATLDANGALASIP